MTVRETLAGGTARLREGNIEGPARDAALLLAGVLRTDRAGIIAAGQENVTENTRARFTELLERRLAGECVAYLLGKKEFRGLDFAVNAAVLVPRPDTETLVEAALEALGSSSLSPPLPFLDLCTGSGAVAVALKHEAPFLEVWASDISAEALEVAAANAARLLAGPGLPASGLPQASVPPQDRAALSPSPPIRFLCGDLFAPFSPALRFAYITANPPYVPAGEIDGLAPEVRREPRLALDGGAEGLDILGRIIAEAPDHLRPGGTLLLEADPRQMTMLRSLLETEGYHDIKIFRDLPGAERVIGGVHPGRSGQGKNV
ncbi:MAG: peptide chain release factor N(5)-glutamine methyltransferase [Treponema sp.]|jgi:release factor glutamine methyltransferase|nr:peptide chain release factor N(5)-glutamine methyltransferase [Treponema sp.]